MPSATRQLLVVTSESWGATHARLRRWARAKGGRWQLVGDELRVELGSAGLGWGAGLDDPRGRDDAEPRKREGDRRAPAGVFALGTAFGEGAAPAGTRMPYRAVDEQLICVDDPAASSLQPAARSRSRRQARQRGEHAPQRRTVHARRGDRAQHGADPAAARSCVFVHVWAGPEVATTGCTAMARADLELLLRWLDPAAQSLIVQLPSAIVTARRRAWRLP